MKNFISLAAILAVAVMFGGCTTMPGVLNGIGDDPMSMIVLYRTDNQPLTLEQYALVVGIAKEASETVGLQLSSSLEAAASSGFPYGLAGVAGGIIDGTVTAAVTGTAAFLGGVMNGLQTASYANAWLVADIVEVTMRDKKEAGDGRFSRLHVSAAFTRTKNALDAPATGLIGARK